MLKELIKEVAVLQDKEKFLDKLLSQCISLISVYPGKDKLKARIYIDKIDDSIREYNLRFVNKESE